MSLVSRRKLWALFEALYSQELNSESKQADTPPWIKTPLLPHQRSALAAALDLEKAKESGIEVGDIPGDQVGGRMYASHGILGDRVGSGKSLTALALVKAPPPSPSYVEFVTRTTVQGEGRDVGILRHRTQTHTNYGQTLRPVSTSLFLVPHALISQWETYVTRDTTLRALFIKRKLDATSETFMTNLETYDAVFVSSTMWATLKQTHPIRTLLWNRVFVDEADSISVTTDWDDVNGLFYWFISASWLNLVFAAGVYFNIAATFTPPPDTPTEVIRRVSALQAGGQYLSIAGCRHLNIVRRMCGVSIMGNTVSLNAAGIQSSRLIIHSSEDYIQESFRSPEVLHTYVTCSTPVNIRVLDQFISAEMLERLHAGDLAGALESIGMTAHSETEVASAVTDSLRKELDQARRTHEFKKTIEYSSDAAKQRSLELCEQKIASLESRISAIEDRLQRAKEQTCPICFCDVTKPSVTPCCQQLFCFPCLCESLKRTSACPLCRARINDVKQICVVGESNTIVPADKVEQLLDTEAKLNKKDSFLRFVRKNPSAKILTFSGYDATFTGLEHALEMEGSSYATLNGSQARIDKLLREFGAGKYTTLFLNARNMGAGLNIEAATHVVLFHKMSSELEKQIIGRALRLGRTTPLEVVHLVHDNEVGQAVVHA